MIQDITPHTYHNEYRPIPPDRDSILLCYRGRQALASLTDDAVAYPTFEEVEACTGIERLYDDYTYLFSIDDKRFYLGNEKIANKLLGSLPGAGGLRPSRYQWVDTQKFRGVKTKYLSFAGLTGWQLYRWYDSHRFCGHCGRPLVKDEKERMLKCPECGLMEFPKICPAVIIGVTHGNRILMSKYAGREYKNYALLAGFAEVGEAIEETVRREVVEEVGLKVKNITYYKSQPWSLSDTLLFGFFCELDGEEDITLDREELALAEWFERENIPVEPEDFSLTNEMMMVFKNGGIDAGVLMGEK